LSSLPSKHRSSMSVDRSLSPISATASSQSEYHMAWPVFSRPSPPSSFPEAISIYAFCTNKLLSILTNPSSTSHLPPQLYLLALSKHPSSHIHQNGKHNQRYSLRLSILPSRPQPRQSNCVLQHLTLPGNIPQINPRPRAPPRPRPRPTHKSRVQNRLRHLPARILRQRTKRSACPRRRTGRIF
jgi:hypothetical protein